MIPMASDLERIQDLLQEMAAYKHPNGYLQADVVIEVDMAQPRYCARFRLVDINFCHEEQCMSGRGSTLLIAVVALYDGFKRMRDGEAEKTGDS